MAPIELFVKVAATGEQPAGALTVNDEIGFVNTVTVDVWVSEQPAAVEAVRFTVYIIFDAVVFVNVSVGSVAEELFPLPKFQLYIVAFADVLVKFTVRVGHPLIGVSVKSAVGLTLIFIVCDIVCVQFAVFTINSTVYVFWIE